LAQKNDEADDLRVRRTRKLLQEALIALTVEKGFAAITVRDITERAMVNRSTFYRHYLDKYDLLDQYMDEVYELINVPEAPPSTDAPGAPPPEQNRGLVNMLRHISTFADFYRVMLGANGDTRFIQRFRQNVENRFRYLLANQEPDPNGPPLELRLSFISCADIGAILWWLENAPHWSPEEFAQLISPLVRASAGLPPMRPPQQPG
jgi:AcrR family transcriptional regulator